MAEKTTLISLDTGGIAGIAAAVVALKGLGKVLSSISQGVKEAFTVEGYRDYLQTVSRFGKNLAKELLVLQMAFGRLKVAIAKAFAPILEVVVPYINRAIFAMIRFADTVHQFLRGLIAGIGGTDALADSAQNAAESEEALAKAASSAGKAAKRSLMGLDQLERLNAPTGGGSSYSFAPYDGTVTAQVQSMVDRFMALIKPLLDIDLSMLKTELQSLWEALTRLAALAGDAISYLWYEVLTPFAKWLMEILAPVLASAGAGGLELVAAAAETLLLGMNALWQALQPVVKFIGGTVVLLVNQWRLAFLELAGVIQEKGAGMAAVFQNVGQVFQVLWNKISPILKALRASFMELLGGLTTTVSTMVGFITDILQGLTEFLAGAFTGDWKRAWEGIKTFMKGLVNGIIGLLNTMIARIVSALNAVIRAANSLSFAVPDWVPSIGGRKFGLSLRTVTAPQIPYLAQGAVLPANRPFLAMVGDQKHGTNVEAPLATIQEAVATVMEDQTAAILAGFETSTRIQRDILEAVLGISIGDEVIANAVSRYNRKLAVVRGGAI